jgi:hypothetical protein
MTGPYQPRGLTLEEQESIMTRIELTRKVLLLEKERDQLREINLKLRDKLLELAKECDPCGGTGCVKTDCEPIMVIDCPACLDIRELLA